MEVIIKSYGHSPTAAPSKRLYGLDLARAFAIVGMVLVNFKIVMVGHGPAISTLDRLLGLLEGRAAATFVMLAGIGISLMAKKALASAEPSALSNTRSMLLKRATFLFLVGLAYTPVWPADILHFYGMYILLATLCLTWSNRRIMGLAMALPFLFVILLFTLDYEQGWNWQTLSYEGLWTLPGMIRHLFFNGFHPVIPWAAFLIFGMWVGRQQLTDARLRRRLMGLGLAATLITESLSKLALFVSTSTLENVDKETAVALLGSAPMPPMPWYLFSAGGLALAFICLCIEVAQRFPNSALLKRLVETGQLALTHYVAHVLVGMGTLEALGMLENQTAATSILAALIFSVCAILFSWTWRHFFKRGPLEYLMRRLTG